eukprot:scaffold321656_cov31-Tisochrysis_lutea.AAC.2
MPIENVSLHSKIAMSMCKHLATSIGNIRHGSPPQAIFDFLLSTKVRSVRSQSPAQGTTNANGITPAITSTRRGYLKLEDG